MESSENRVEKLKKHGRPAAIAFPVLCALIGGIIGAKVPGLGQAPAIAVGVVLGFIVGALLSLVLYCGYKRKFENQRRRWNDVESSNQYSIAQGAGIPDQRSKLHDILQDMNGIEEGNLHSGVKNLKVKINNY